MKTFNTLYISLFFILIIVTTTMVVPVSHAKDEEILRADQSTIDAWRELRFGMFIHWGPVSLTGKEIGWSRASETASQTTAYAEYDQLFKQFDPESFNASQWVEIAKKAGMRYMVFTSRHHDGFTMWDSNATDYDIMSTPFKRDVMKELSLACKQNNMIFSPYYSICDWYQPDYGYSHRAQPGYELGREPDINRHIAYIKNQLREMQKNYGPFNVFWFDGEWEEPWTHEMGVDLNNFCKTIQPGVLVNNRVDKGRQGMQGMSKSGEFAGDFGTPEQEVGAFNRDTPWETCMTIGRQWSWKPDDELKSVKECLQTLLYTIGGDGNLLFNVGPMPDGRIEPRQVERLRKMGEWIDRYSEAIYGTRGGPYKPGDWGASTCKGNVVYLFIMNWKDGAVEFPALPAQIERVKLLSGGEIHMEKLDGAIRIHKENPQINNPQMESPNDIATVIALELDQNAFRIPPMNVE